MVPVTDAAPSTPCNVLEYVFTKKWNEAAGYTKYTNMLCIPAGKENGERVFRITADFTSRYGVHYKFRGILDSSGFDYDFQTWGAHA